MKLYLRLGEQFRKQKMYPQSFEFEFFNMRYNELIFKVSRFHMKARCVLLNYMGISV